MRKKTLKKHPIHLKLAQHLAMNTSIGILLIAAALVIGMLGYHGFERMSWTDSFLNASMICFRLWRLVDMSQHPWLFR